MDNSPRKLRFGLPRSARLNRSAEIRKVLQNGAKLTGSSINLFFMPAERGRFAVVVPKRVGNAVRRNRMKRLVREIYRTRPDLFANKQVVFFVKRFNRRYDRIEKQIVQMLSRG
ncbi:MAG: ribonuclease P protein component [Calditrichaceae bacterium]|nr:ribonuclease P protein component [Calditrichaceae bacterium]